MKHKIKVIILPTEDKSNIFQCRNGQTLYTENTGTNTSFSTYIHTYITVSQDVEPIKEGDWCYDEYNKVVFKSGSNNPGASRKIIATTAPKLIYSPNWKGKEVTDCLAMPQVPQSFLKEYVANPDGEWEVEYSYKGEQHNESSMLNTFHIKLNQDNTVNITSVEEKMYSKKELILISEYVRVGHQSTPKVKTLTLIDEYLSIKENL